MSQFPAFRKLPGLPISGAYRNADNRIVVVYPDPPAPPPSTSAVEHLAAAYALYGNVTPVATRNAMGVIFNADDQYNGGSLLPSGHIIGAPVLTDTFLNINTNNDTAVRDTLGTTLNPLVRNFNSAVLCQELNRVYFIPRDAGFFLVFDTSLTPALLYQGTLGVTLPSNWRGAVRAANGKIYCCPITDDCLVIDPLDTTASAFGTGYRTTFGVDMSEADKWLGIARADNDLLYCVPSDESRILIIDPSDLTAGPHGTAFLSTMGTAPNMTNPNKWQGAVLGADGCIYGVPFNSTDICKIDPNDQTGSIWGTLTRSTMGAGGMGGTSKWQCGCNGPDGRIYCFPRSAHTILRIDPIAGTASTETFGADLWYDQSKWQSGHMALNGSIYMIPQDASDILKIEFPGVPPLLESITLGPYLNKL